MTADDDGDGLLGSSHVMKRKIRHKLADDRVLLLLLYDLAIDLLWFLSLSSLAKDACACVSMQLRDFPLENVIRIIQWYTKMRDESRDSSF
jgi:hypothetical protein